MDRLPGHLRTALARSRDEQRQLPRMEASLESAGLATVCREARCPNRGVCYREGRLTFLVLGTVCTRGCPFCGVTPGRPLPPDPGEPARLAEAVTAANLRRVVITSVTRDDLDDGGAEHLAACHEAVLAAAPAARVELLLPDFGGDRRAAARAVRARPAVAGHNVETVPRLYPALRPRASYARSLGILETFASLGLTVRSGIMVGLGETPEEVVSALHHLRRAGVDQVVIGQYLPPSPRHARLVSYLPREAFDELRRTGYSLGFSTVLSAPLARSSMDHAGEQGA